MASITLYFDLTSTFSYPALYLLTTHPTFSSTPLRVVPIFLGGVFQSTGNKAPPMIPAKVRYLSMDYERKCKKFSVPTTPEFPKKFPFNSAHAQRAAIAAGQLYGDETQTKVVRELAIAFWAKGELDPVDKAQLEGALGRILGDAGKAKKVMEMSVTEEVKKRLVENTEEAVKAGAFGAPWMVVKKGDGKEVVAWGVDALDVVAEALGKSWPPRDIKASL